MPNEPVPQKQNIQLIEQFVKNQGKELEQRAQELDLEKQKDANAFEYGKLALEAQERDRKHERERRRGERRDRYFLIGGALVLLVILVGGAMMMGYANIAMEIAKAVALLAAGAWGGYGYARSKDRDDDE